MSAADKLRQQGKVQGRAEGRAEGRVEGRAAALIKQLTLKFGSPSAKTRNRIEAASIDDLDRMVERILSANSLQEVFGGKTARPAKLPTKKKR